MGKTLSLFRGYLALNFMPSETKTSNGIFLKLEDSSYSYLLEVAYSHESTLPKEQLQTKGKHFKVHCLFLIFKYFIFLFFKFLLHDLISCD